VRDAIDLDALRSFGVRADLFWRELPDVDDEPFRQIRGLLNAVVELPIRFGSA